MGVERGRQADRPWRPAFPKLGPTNHLLCKFVIKMPRKRVQRFSIFEKCCILVHSPHLGDLQFTGDFKGYEKSYRVFWFYLLEIQTCLSSEPSLRKYLGISHVKSFVDYGMDGRCCSEWTRLLISSWIIMVVAIGMMVMTATVIRAIATDSWWQLSAYYILGAFQNILLVLTHWILFNTPRGRLCF